MRAMAGSAPPWVIAEMPVEGTQERRHGRPSVTRHGDRRANSALWRIVVTLSVYDPRSRPYLESRTGKGRTRPKSHPLLHIDIAREIYAYLPREDHWLDNPEEHQSPVCRTPTPGAHGNGCYVSVVQSVRQ